MKQSIEQKPGQHNFLYTFPFSHGEKGCLFMRTRSSSATIFLTSPLNSASANNEVQPTGPDRNYLRYIFLFCMSCYMMKRKIQIVFVGFRSSFFCSAYREALNRYRPCRHFRLVSRNITVPARENYTPSFNQPKQCYIRPPACLRKTGNKPSLTLM